MTPEQILAATLWAEDRGGSEEGMEPIAGVMLNRAESPGWWGRDVVGVCLSPGQFSGWHWKDPNFRKCLTVDESDPQYVLALAIARTALRGDPIKRANGADHYYAKSMTIQPAWASVDGNLRPIVYETAHHFFLKVGLFG